MKNLFQSRFGKTSFFILAILLIGTGFINHFQKTDSQIVVSQHSFYRAQSIGQKMIDFIREILGDKQKPIDDRLVRDEQ